MRKRPAIALSAGSAEFSKLVRANAHRHRVYDVFRDFCELSALSISNSVDRLHRERREARYLEIVGKYAREEVERFPAMLACVVNELEAGMSDVLGRLFMGLELGDAGKGQFFTPFELSSLMARMVMGDAAAAVQRQGFITLSEPAVGAGGMVIAAADALHEQGINYQQAMHVVAVDIDPTACHMAYIQFSLLHIPAVVVHGNALWPEQTWDEWMTPAHVLGGWDRKLAQRRSVEAMRELLTAGADAAEGAPALPAPIEAEQAPASVTVERVMRKREEQAAQMALF